MMKGVNPVRNFSGALNPAEMILKRNSAAEQWGIISNGVKLFRVLGIKISINLLQIKTDLIEWKDP